MNIFYHSTTSKSVFIAVVTLLMGLGTSCKEKPLSVKKAVDYTYMANQEVDQKGATEAQLLGFAEGVKEVEFGFDAGFGYSYEFDRNGGLVAIHMFDHGYKGTMTWSDGKAVKSVGDDEGFGDDEPDEPSHYEVMFDYRSKGKKTELYSSTNGEKEELTATIYYDDEGRIVRAESEETTISFKYDKDGRAFNENGEEVYPPMALFFSETPLLPKNHKVLLADDLGRPLKADSHEGHNHYTITYWD